MSLQNLKRKISYDPSLQLTPGIGKTILRAVREFGQPINSAHNQIKNEILKYSAEHNLQKTYHQAFGHFEISREVNIEDIELVNLISSASILTWLCGNLLGEITKESSLLDAVRWYGGASLLESLLSNIPNHISNKIISPLQMLTLDSHFVAIMPYAIEVLETDNELISELGKARKRKRKSGVFYTPSDVAEMIIVQVLDLSKSGHNTIINKTWLDPACGSGIFLISIINYALKLCDSYKLTDVIDFIISSLYGIDQSAGAIQATIHNLALRICFLDRNRNFRETQEILGNNFYVIDSTKLDSIDTLSSI